MPIENPLYPNVISKFPMLRTSLLFPMASDGFPAMYRDGKKFSAIGQPDISPAFYEKIPLTKFFTTDRASHITHRKYSEHPNVMRLLLADISKSKYHYAASPLPQQDLLGRPLQIFVITQRLALQENTLKRLGDFPQGRLRELSQNRPLGFTKVGQKDSPNIIWRIPQYGIMGYFRKACRDFPKPAKRFLYIRHSLIIRRTILPN